MNLYNIDTAIRSWEPEVDEATGEVLNFAELEQLEQDRTAKIENIALWIKDLTADAKAIREEEKALAERRQKLERKAESLSGYVQSALDGEKFETARVAISYRKSTKLQVDPEFVAWATKHNSLLLRFKNPEPDAAVIKDLLKHGEELEFARLVENRTMTIK